MWYFVILLILVGFSGSVFAQNLGEDDEVWLPACLKENKTGCDYSSLFHDSVSRPFAQSDSVAVGTIIQKEKQERNSIKYSINVNFYLKNYQPFDLLTATLNNATEPQTFPEVLYYNSPVFNEGDLVFVYLKKIEGQYNILPESFALDKQEVRGPPPTILLTKSPFEDTFEQGDVILVSGEVRKMDLVKAAKDGKQLDVKLMLHDEDNHVIFSDLIDIDVDGSYNYGFQTSTIPPGKYELEVNYGPSTTSDRITIEFNPQYWTPLKQFKSGIPITEIQCREGLAIILKSSDGLPACVKPETKKILIERGWAKTESMFSSVESNYDPYNTRCGSGVVPAISTDWQLLGMTPSDKNWESLGRYLIQQKFYQELKNRNIIFTPACFGVHTGPIEESYPPRFAMCSTVTGTNGTQLYLEGTVYEFNVTYFNIGNEIPYECGEHKFGCLCQFK